ncbi:hypothetical protein Pint_24743 [Pistacia integerrima]|uniref:Uncharacterized protein n=1 Tax=Pistacia integerrima TaxID=434235 RepID=A0ACC0YG45_9ROSI|nr:hypothetical protein Pint_24743 [Pistacia integerrima]
MYEESGCFDPNNSMAEGADSRFPQSLANNQKQFEENLKLSTEEISEHHHNHQQDAAVSAMELKLQKHLSFNVENCDNDTYMMQQVVGDPNQLLSYDQSNWNNGDIDFNQDDPQQNGHRSFNINSLPQTPDFLTLFHLPISSLLQNSSIFFANSNHDTIPLGFIGDLPASNSTSVLNMACIVRGSETGKQKKPFTTERQRREHWNDKFTALRNLVIPDPTKSYNGCLRSSWLQRLSKDTEVDVRIIDANASASGATVYRAVSVPSFPEFVQDISDLLHKDIHVGHIFIKYAHRHIMLAFAGSIYEHHYIVDEHSTQSPSSCSSSSSISTWAAAP